jgi:Flp pilus assembly protein TadG
MAQSTLSLFCRSQSGAAAVEMALVTPFLLALMFGSFELGNYFYSEHVVAKAVRDGARFASRQSFTSFSGCSGVPSGTIAVTLPSAANISTEDAIRNIVRTGQIANSGTPRLASWNALHPATNAKTVTVAISCNTANASVANGIYTAQTGGVRIVTVAAKVRYTSLFGILGLSGGSSLDLNAQSQAVVVGI